MKQNVEPCVRFLNTYAERETKEIYEGSRSLLASTLIGVFIGILTNVSAEFLIKGEISLGFIFLMMSVGLVLFSFLTWRVYLVRDLQKYIEKMFYEEGEALKEKFEKDFKVSSSEEKND